MLNLVTAWRECALDKPPYVFQGDEIKGIIHKSYTSFVASEDFGISSAKFHLGLIPQPYIGNLAEAKIFLLFLNPGFNSGDYYAPEHSPSFRQARKANLYQQGMSVDYPFFYLDPAFAWTAGGQWWQAKLQTVISKLSTHKKLADTQVTSYLAAMQHASKQLACLELCPYFSKTYSSPSKRLHSSELLLDYVRNDLKQRSDSGEVSVIVLRQSKAWDLPESGNVRWLTNNQARGAHLTMNTEAGEFIYNRLVSLL